MNSTHALAGGTGATFGAALAAVIAGTCHIDPDLAANWVIVLSGAATFAGAGALWFARWKWPGLIASAKA